MPLLNGCFNKEAPLIRRASWHSSHEPLKQPSIFGPLSHFFECGLTDHLALTHTIDDTHKVHDGGLFAVEFVVEGIHEAFFFGVQATDGVKGKGDFTLVQTRHVECRGIAQAQ